MSEWKLFGNGIPECTTAKWYETRERAPHLEQAGHRDRLIRSAEIVRELIQGYEFTPSVVDIGCGDGGLLSLIKDDHIKAWGYDISPEAVNAAVNERGVDARLLDFVENDIEWGRIAVATEVLEHLVDPHAFVNKIAEHSSILIASSPAFESPSMHYEFHTWAWDMEGYRALIEQAGYEVVSHEVVRDAQIICGVQA